MPTPEALDGPPRGSAGAMRVLTPHPGEMARLTGKNDRGDAGGPHRRGARATRWSIGVTLVLKGERTLIAFPDGRVWINPTGSPAMATGGTGDILTGIIAGLLAQFPQQPDQAVAAAVYLHGLAGELGAREIGGEMPDRDRSAALSAARVEECAGIPHRV